MNKEQFLQTLKSELSKLPEVEQNKILNYYTEYISDACENGQEESAVIQSMGSVEQLAQGLIRDHKKETIFEEAKEKPTLSNGFKVLIALFALFSAPITVPLGIAIILVLFTFILVIIVLLLAILIVSLAFIFASAVLLITGFQSILTQPSLSIATFGLALINLGLGTLIFLLFGKIIQLFVKLFALIGRKLSKKTKKGANHYEQ